MRSRKGVASKARANILKERMQSNMTGKEIAFFRKTRASEPARERAAREAVTRRLK